MTRALDSQLEHCGFDCQPFLFRVTTLGRLFALTWLCHQTVYKLIGTSHTALMLPYGWEGNRRSGVTLAMRHKLVI